MDRSIEVAYIHHSKLLFLPLIGSLLYIIQLYLYQKGLLNVIYISRHENKLRDYLLESLSKRPTIIVCRSFKFGRILKNIKSEIILDTGAKVTENLSKEESYSLMWSLVFASSVTPETKKVLKDFLPEDFPIKKTIVIPYNDSFKVVCDYIFQTARVLANKKNVVYLVALANPVSILKYLLGKSKEKTDRQEFFDKNKIVVIRPLTLLPLRLTKFKFIEKINRYAILTYVSYFIKKTKADYLWCFDTSDVELVKFAKPPTKTIYDCVDYFSSLDTSTDKKIKADETKLINSVDFFFVNSHSLKKTKGAIRNPDVVVPQGFDIDSFLLKEPLTRQEKREIENLKRLFKKIPKPRVGFVGSLTYRLDFKLLSSLISKMPNVFFVFTDFFLPMPHDDKFVNTEKLISKIRKSQNVYFVPKTFSRRVIKKVLKNLDVGIIPYNPSFDFNKYCYPMKLFEYFYMGLPVISTPIEELKRFPKFIKIGRSAEECVKHIKNLLSKPLPKEHKDAQKKLAKENSWERKIEQILIMTR